MIPLNNNLLRLKRSGIRHFSNLAKTVPGCVMLTLGEPDFDTPEEIKAAALTSLFQNRTHYAANQGVEALRQEIAAFETIRGLPREASQVLVTAGASEALYTAITGILNPGDEVIIPVPSFVCYGPLAEMTGAKAVYVELKVENEFRLTAEELKAAITPKTKFPPQ